MIQELSPPERTDVVFVPNPRPELLTLRMFPLLMLYTGAVAVLFVVAMGFAAMILFAETIFVVAFLLVGVPLLFFAARRKQPHKDG